MSLTLIRCPDALGLLVLSSLLLACGSDAAGIGSADSGESAAGGTQTGQLPASPGAPQNSMDQPPAAVDGSDPGATDQTPETGAMTSETTPAPLEPFEVVGEPCAGNPILGSSDCPGGTCYQAVGLTPAPGGYCSRECETDADCGSMDQGHCASLAGAASRCLKLCEDVSECRDGYECAVSPTDITGSITVCRPVPETDQLEDNVAGTPCSGDDGCPGGRCEMQIDDGKDALGGYCTGDCFESLDCGFGGLCAGAIMQTNTLGTCYATCGNDSECREAEGYECRVPGSSGSGATGLLGTPACVPAIVQADLADGVVGSACTDDATCGETGQCLDRVAFGMIDDEAPGGYCSGTCTNSDQCGPDGACMCDGGACNNLLGETGICLLDCQTGSDCRTDYTCNEPVPALGAILGAMGETYCLPRTLLRP